MGLCGCSTDNIDKHVHTELLSSAEWSNKVHKLLLLGPGNSGKSTFFKQLAQIHGHGFSENDKKNTVKYIFNNIIDQIKAVVTNFKDLKRVENGNKEKKEKKEELLLESMDYIERLSHDTNVISAETAMHIIRIWSTLAIKESFKHRKNLKIVDSSPYFFENIERISNDKYTPTIKDILLARIPTTGIREIKFQIDHNIFELYDVGGQRSERSKWIHCFTHVHAVLFVVSLSCYDQHLYENVHINAMHEGIQLWDEIANSHYFTNRRTSMIIFFNKSDLFKSKILSNRKSLRLCWTHYNKRDLHVQDAIDFITQQFLDIVVDKQKRVFTHVTCATDINNVQNAFNDVQRGVVMGALTKNGIL